MGYTDGTTGPMRTLAMPPSASSGPRSVPEIVIRPPRAFASIKLRELWAYRFLLLSMTQRRLRMEFDQQHLAWLWAVARPLLMVLIFALFRNLSEARTGVHIAYALYVYSGLVLWFHFTETVQDTAASVKQNAALIQKVYFPRIINPLAAILANLVTLSIAIVPLALMMLAYGEFPGWRLVLLPAVILQVELMIFGLGCLFAALSLTSADWDRLLAFALYIGLFVSPVIYAPAMLPANAQPLYALNPMVGSLLAIRSSLFAGFDWPAWEWNYSLAMSATVAVVGLLVFQRAEKHLVDRL